MPPTSTTDSPEVQEQYRDEAEQMKYVLRQREKEALRKLCFLLWIYPHLSLAD